jgi:D-3-phosphoglycerate dehydrogenase
MTRILILEPNGYSPRALDILRSVATLEKNTFTAEELPAKLANYEVLIVRLGYRIDREFLAQAKNLKVIVSPTTGLNHIDLEATQDSGITVLSLKGETDFLNSVTATAEHTWGLLLALIRHLPTSVEDVRNGQWRRDLFKGNEVSGKTLGIIGCGRLGRHVARYAEAFGMRVIVNDVRQIDGYTQMPLDDLLKQADIISVHASYHEGTHHLLNAEKFALTKQGVLLINTSRGEIIDEAALLAGLQSGTVGGAALDVLSGENSGQADWLEHDPLVAYAKTHRNLLITPHVGGATAESMEKTEIFMAGKLAEFIG